MTSEAQKIASKKWRSKNKEHIREYDKNRNTPPEKRREWNRRSRNKAKQKVDKVLGDSCFVCGKWHSRFNDHEINGVRHPTNCWYKLKHIEDFVRLCPSCHRGIHWCMNHLGLTWKEIKTGLIHHPRTY